MTEEVTLTKSEAEGKRLRRVQSSLANPALFAELYVRPFDPNWIAPLPAFGREMLAFVTSPQTRRGVVVLPPEFLKTTLISQALPLWLTARSTAFGEMLRGLLLSEEEGMAAGNLGFVKWHIDNNELLAADFIDENGRPLMRPDPTEKVWREDAIVVARRGVSKDPTWQAKGLDSKGVQGRRLDWLIGDDVITPKNAFSPAMRKSALNLWELSLTTRLVEQGKAIIAGNFNDHRDLLSTLSSRTSYRTFRRPAIHAKADPNEARSLDADDGEITWPENWSRRRLEQEQEDKPQRFRRIFLLDARAERGEALRTDWVTLISESEIPVDEARFFVSIDPAPGGVGRDDHDFFTITVGARHASYLDVVESIAIRGSIPQQVKLVAALHDRYERVGAGVRAIGGAKVALDRYFRGALTVAAPQLESKLVEVSIPGSKVERLEGLGSYAQSRFLRVVAGVWTAQTSAVEDRYQELSLAEEWSSFPHGRHDDRLDGLDVLIRTAREYDYGAVREVDLEAA